MIKLRFVQVNLLLNHIAKLSLMTDVIQMMMVMMKWSWPNGPSSTISPRMSIWSFIEKNHQLQIKGGDSLTYKFAGGMKINKLQHTHIFLYYIFIIIIICSLVFHIVIIVIVITSCDNLKQIKQYCLFLLNCPVSS